MKTKLMALALTMALCNSSTLAPLALAAATKAPQSPVIRSTISQNTTQLELTMGKAQVIRLSSPASRVSISDPQVVGVVLISPTEVELIGKAVGVANLLIWNENSGSNYTTIDLSVHRDVSTLANKIQMIDPGINILPVAAEDSVILTGVAESQDKAQLAYDLAKAFFSEDRAGQGQANEVSSNSPGSALQAQSSTKIINLIRVMGQPTTKAEMVQEQLKNIDPNIKLSIVPGFGGKEKAILMGRVKNSSAVSKAINLAGVFYGTPGIKILAGQGGNLVKEEGGSSSSSNDSSFTAGSGGDLVSNFAGNILHGSIMTDASGNVVSMLEVEERPQIKCTIKFLEVQKTNVNNYTISHFLAGETARFASYQGGLGQGVVAGTTTNVLFTTIESFFNQVNGANNATLGIRYGGDFSSVLNGLVSNGVAKVLAEPTLTSISGEPASFLAGGEFPIPLINSTGGVSIIFKEFGIRLNMLATVTDRGTVHMQVSPEVSALDANSSVNISGFRVPGLSTRRSQSVLEMNNGDYFVLSGLYNDSSTRNLIKTPLLGQLPILGTLFRSKAFQEAKTEIVIVVHPEIQSQMNLSAVESRRDANAPKISADAEAVLKAYQIPGSTTTASEGKPETKADTKILASTDPKAELKAAAGSGTTSDGKPTREFKRALKKAQKEAQRLAKEAQEAKAAEPQPTAKPDSTATAPSTDLGTVSGAAGQVILPAGLEDYLSTQKQELTNLLGRLEASVTPEVVESSPKPSPQTPTAKAPQATAPAAAQKALPSAKPGQTSAKVSDIPAKSLNKATTSGKPLAPKTKATNVPKRVKPTTTGVLPPRKPDVAVHVNKIRQSLTQLLSFNP